MVPPDGWKDGWYTEVSVGYMPEIYMVDTHARTQIHTQTYTHTRRTARV